MPKSLPEVLLRAKNLLATGAAWLILLHVVLKDGLTEFWLCNNNSPIIFPAPPDPDSQEYTPFPFIFKFPEENSRGELSFAELQVSNVTRIFQYYLEAYNGGLGSTVTVTLVNSEHLADLGVADYDGLSITLDVLNVKSNNLWATLKLGYQNLMLVKFPNQKYNPFTCGNKFNYPRPGGISPFPECGYLGAQTSCNRTYEDCMERNMTARFNGYVGLGPGGLRVA